MAISTRPGFYPFFPGSFEIYILSQSEAILQFFLPFFCTILTHICLISIWNWIWRMNIFKVTRDLTKNFPYKIISIHCHNVWIYLPYKCLPQSKRTLLPQFQNFNSYFKYNFIMHCKSSHQTYTANISVYHWFLGVCVSLIHIYRVWEKQCPTSILDSPQLYPWNMVTLASFHH